jgi:hypothetical protein
MGDFYHGRVGVIVKHGCGEKMEKIVLAAP